MRQALASTVRGTLAVGSLVVLLALAPARARATSYLFVPLDVPGATATEAWAIDDAGRVVGEFRDASGATGFFLYDGSTYTTLSLPGAPRGINDAGLMVGYFQDVTASHGFVSDGVAHSSFDLPFSGASQMRVGAINDLDQIVGSYEVSGTGTHGFVKDGDSYTTLDVPGASFNGTVAHGINDAGQVVGYFWTLGACPFPPFCSEEVHGFVTDGASYTTLDFPGAGARTIALGINGAGDIVGYYNFGAVPDHGFVRRGAFYATLDAPGASQTRAYDINDSGQIVGFFRDASEEFHGFLAIPVPEPPAAALLAASVAVIGWRRRPRSRRVER